MNNKRIKIVFIIPTLTAGGAQRIMTFLSKNLNQTTFHTTLLVIGTKEGLAFGIDGMNVIFLNKSRVLFAIPTLIRYLISEKPKIIMGAISHLNIALGSISPLFPKIKFVGRQTNIGKIVSKHSTPTKKTILGSIHKIGFRQLDYVVCQSKDMAQDCMEHFQIKENKIKIIRNPITDSFEFKGNHRGSNPDAIRFITVGRLEKIKGHARILEGLSKFKSKYTYTIIGDGPEKEFLGNLVISLKLEDKVEFISFTKKVPDYLRKSDFFLQGSYAEGFPNALLESCAVGTPVVAWKAPGGTGEIVENEINGWIAEDDEDFLKILNSLGTFNSEKVSESVYKKFSKKIILEEYESFFSKALNI